MTFDLPRMAWLEPSFDSSQQPALVEVVWLVVLALSPEVLLALLFLPELELEIVWSLGLCCLATRMFVFARLVLLD